jgi:hypothetical protein
VVAQAVDFSAALETQRDEPEGVIVEADVQRAALILVSSAEEASRKKALRLQQKEPQPQRMRPSTTNETWISPSSEQVTSQRISFQ